MVKCQDVDCLVLSWSNGSSMQRRDSGPALNVARVGVLKVYLHAVIWRTSEDTSAPKSLFSPGVNTQESTSGIHPFRECTFTFSCTALSKNHMPLGSFTNEDSNT